MSEATTNVELAEMEIPMHLWRGLQEAGLLPAGLPLVDPDSAERASL